MITETATTAAGQHLYWYSQHNGAYEQHRMNLSGVANQVYNKYNHVPELQQLSGDKSNSSLQESTISRENAWASH